MQGPPASEASTSTDSKPSSGSGSSDGPVRAARLDAFAPLDLDIEKNGCTEARYEQPDFAIKTKDERLPTFDTKHAGVTALRRIFIGPSFRGTNQDPFAVQNQRAKHAEDNTSEKRARRLLPFVGRKRSATGVSRLSFDGSILTEGTMTPNRPEPDDSAGWQGASFEIGGDLRDAARRRDARLARQRAEAEQPTRPPPPTLPERHSMPLLPAVATTSPPPKSPALSSMTGASFATAQTHLPTPAISPAHSIFSEPVAYDDGPKPHHEPPTIEVIAPRSLRRASMSRDNTQLRAEHPPNLRSILRTPEPATVSRNSFTSARSEPAPAPAVRFPDTPAAKPDFGPGSGAAPPARPTEVLARPDEEIPEAPTTRARLGQALRGHPGLAIKPTVRSLRAPDDVIRHERMLVRVDWSPRNDLPDVFDEHVAKKYPTVRETWSELAVVWRHSGQLELWTEHRLNMAAKLIKRKKLEAVIPLDPKATHLSLYSATDLIFCLTFQPNQKARHMSRAVHSRARDDRSNTVTHADTTRSAKHAKASKRAYLHPRSNGTNIFLFRPRTQAIAKEWMWRLYRALGGRLPPILEVRVPGLDARLYFKIPLDHDPNSGQLYDRADEDRGYRHLQPDIVIEKCIERLSSVKQWEELVETAQRQGTSFKLAWRRGSTLDWIQSPAPGEELPDWAVVGGFAFRQAGNLPVLELRPAAHYPTTCRVPADPKCPHKNFASTVRIAEPPGIEGFAIVAAPNQRSQRVYLSTRLNLLFRTRPTLAHAPDPPLQVHNAMNNPAAVVLAPFIAGMATLAQPDRKKRERIWSPIARSVLRDRSRENRKRRDWALQSLNLTEVADQTFGKPHNHDDEFDDHAANCDGNQMLEYLEMVEKKRGFLQVSDAQGYVQLSEIVAVDPELEANDHEAAGLDDRTRSRKLRTLTVKFNSGVTAKLECPSNEVRDEWVARLRALATYWTRRQRIDAVQHMELSGADSMVCRIPPRNPHTRNNYEEGTEGEAQPPLTRDEVLSSQHLTYLYNWCLLDGCRAIMKEGVMHVKHGVRGMYKLRHLILMPGILLEFQHVERDMNGQPLPSPYHRRRNLLHLRDCYVYSGNLAGHLNAPNASTNQWDPADESEHQFPRCYPGTDCLRSADERDDCTFVIMKIKHSKSGANCNLGRKGKSNFARVYRTRSKLERDLFVYALNLSIERLLRGEQEREENLRDFSWLSDIDS